MTAIGPAKAAARRLAFAARARAHNADAGAMATTNLLDFLTPHFGKAMSAYMPIRTEINCLPAMATLSLTGPVGVPVVIGPAQPLEFHRWQPNCTMTDGPFGARVPFKKDPLVPRVVILPLLAFDAQGNRLGYGGGYYDRTLEILRARGPVLAVGFAYDAQEISTVPAEPTDQKLDAIITQTRTLSMSSLFQ